MLKLARRCVVVAALMFWQGGFTFYASVVVPVGADVFTHADQGFITRRVTNWLNLAGAIALPIFALDNLTAAEPALWRRLIRWLAWLVAAVALVVLVVQHELLDEMLDPSAFKILDRPAFRSLHSIYLWVSSVQWGAMLVWLAATLMCWRAGDRT
jgi:hypothetical protein